MMTDTGNTDTSNETADTSNDRGESAAISSDLEHSVETSPTVVTVFADAALAELLGETVQVSFVDRFKAVSRLQWPVEHTQPTQVALNEKVVEVARVRLTWTTANNPALNLLAELASDDLFDLTAFERNVEIVRQVANARAGK